jgi:putative addiction module component (TIGR02574 family)
MLPSERAEAASFSSSLSRIALIGQAPESEKKLHCRALSPAKFNGVEGVTHRRVFLHRWLECSNYTPEELAMSASFNRVASEAMKLSPEERIDLAEKLWVSVDTSSAVEEARKVEIERRLAQLDAGDVDTLPVDEVIVEARARLR